MDLYDTADNFGDTHGRADNFSTAHITQLGEKSSLQTSKTVETNNETSGFSDKIRTTMSGFGHRDDFITGKSTRCATRIRLTPSSPSTVGTMFYAARLPVLQGFDTIFEFQGERANFYFVNSI